MPSYLVEVYMPSEMSSLNQWITAASTTSSVPRG